MPSIETLRLPERDSALYAQLAAASVRHLVLDTGLRDRETQSAWVTVTDDAGTVCFEGAPGPDGHVAVAFRGGARARRARVAIETPRVYRQTDIALDGAWTAHSFWS